MKTSLLIAVLFLTAGPLAAQSHYFGGALGFSKYDFDTGALGRAGVTNITTDERDQGWKVFGGIQFNPVWGMELSYIDFGSFRVRGVAGATPVAGRVHATGWTLAATATLEVNPSLSLSAKVGPHSRRADTSFGGVSGTFVDTGTDPYAGVSANVTLNQRWSLHAAAEHFFSDDAAAFYSAGVKVRF